MSSPFHQCVARRPLPIFGQASVLAMMLLLGACARHAYLPAPLEQDLVAREVATATLDAPAHAALLARLQAGDSFPPAAWSPRLLGLIAVMRARSVTTAAAAVTTALSARHLAGLPPDPAIELGVAHNSDRDPGDDSHWSIGPTFGFLWSPVDKRRIRVALGDAALTAARADVLGASWQARRSALAAATRLELERRRERALTQRLALLDQTIALAREQLEAGLADALDWQLLQIDASDLQLASADGIRSEAVAGAALASALHLPLAALHGLVLDFAPLDAAAIPEVASMQRAALTRHPRILHALAEYAQRERELEFAVANQYPDLRIEPGYLFEQGDNLWSLVGGIVLPLGARLDAEIERAAAARDGARSAFEQVQAEIIDAVQQAHATLLASMQARVAIRRAVQRAATNVAELERLPAFGAAEALLLARAQLQQALAAGRLAEAEVRCHAALYELEFSAAVTLDDDVFARYLDELYAMPGTAADGA